MRMTKLFVQLIDSLPFIQITETLLLIMMAIPLIHLILHHDQSIVFLTINNDYKYNYYYRRLLGIHLPQCLLLICIAATTKENQNTKCSFEKNSHSSFDKRDTHHHSIR
ncbi:hypothetical protein DERF_011501 [Dermatophagoides farinae]|uniref:Uncharacterized protein n=1 Tax=Dermatophagoides farinae TaxID=6954 RepID=A0A922L351_DERFA|nr:hypothetical protein DERF_011501 [Dermatophagoides farinae]